MILIGVDGCPKGWLAVIGIFKNEQFTEERTCLFSGFSEIVALPAKVIAVDIPIGLLSRWEPGGRKADRLARRLLGRRGCSVFSPPIRPALFAKTYEEAKRVCEGHLSWQAWNLLPKIREVDEVLRGRRPQNVFETHPELVFFQLAGRPLPSKKDRQGLEVRKEILQKGRFLKDLSKNIWQRPKGARLEDLLDAYAALVAAMRIAKGEARSLPSPPQGDEEGLPMGIWF